VHPSRFTPEKYNYCQVEAMIMAAGQRIILVNSSRIVGDMLKKVIGKTPGLEIVSNIEDIAKLPEIVEQVEADWAIVLLPPDDQVPKIVQHVITEQISMRFLLMGVDGSHVRMMYNEPHEVPLDEKNLADLLELLRMDHLERIQA
jgi:hypothetical protein